MGTVTIGRGPVKRPIIFLDCDGTLSALRAGAENGLYRCRFQPSCMRALNRIVRETNAQIVVSSAWRYAIHGGSMSPLGFEVMLKACGGVGLTVLGPTRKDKELARDGRSLRLDPDDSRGLQCREWFDIHGDGFGSCVALDDEDDRFAEHGIPLVRTRPTRGLTGADADRAIAILRGGKEAKFDGTTKSQTARIRP